MVASSLDSVMVRISLDIIKISTSNHFEIRPLQLRVPSQTSLVDVLLGVFRLLAAILVDFFVALVIGLLVVAGAEGRVPGTTAGFDSAERNVDFLVVDEEERAAEPPLTNDTFEWVTELLVEYDDVGVIPDKAL